jgi:hypothetical protein
VPDAPTSRLGMYKSASDGSEDVNYTQDIGQNLDKVDAAVGFQIVTSSTRPSSPYPGKPIAESDTAYRTLFSNGTAPASASWVEIPNSSATFNNNLKLASGKQVNIGASGSTAAYAALLSSATGDYVLSSRVGADSVSRIAVRADGRLEWSTGALAADAVLARTGTAALTLTGSLTITGIGQRLRATKTANETVTSSTTLQNDDALTVTLDANSIYRVYMVLLMAGVTAGEIKTSWTAPAGATGFKNCMGPGSDSTSRDGVAATMRYGTHTFTTAVNYGLNDAANFVHAVEQGIVTTTTGGTFVLQWAQQASSATASTIAAGSFLIAEKIG